MEPFLQDIHQCVVHPSCQGKQQLCRGSYAYYHYCCDGVDDRGWGCGYRTLQTICSWLEKQGCVTVRENIGEAPTLDQIQAALVDMQDKPSSFRGSKQWIGSFEVCLCLDYFYEVPCKIIHLKAGQDMKNHMEEIAQHFHKIGCPIMMGGETDCASKGIVGVCLETSALLIVDPHCSERVSSAQTLSTRGFVKWLPITELHSQSFYNLCLPKPVLTKS